MLGASIVSNAVSATFLKKTPQQRSRWGHQRVGARQGALLRDLRAGALASEAPINIDELGLALENKAPAQIIDEALERFGNDISIAFSGAEDVALIHFAKETGRPFRVFSLDTGRLHPETYRFFHAVEQFYDIKIEYTFPDQSAVENLVRTKGLFSFFEDGHKECCGIRKVKPLRKYLSGVSAWITGQRKDQSLTRVSVPIVQIDPAFEGQSGGPGSLVKFNPLANISSKDLWTVLRTSGVPTNSLHEKGFVSIGCEPCTRPVVPGQHEREGRWWWEEDTMKECGLHKGNMDEEAQEKQRQRELNVERDLWDNNHGGEYVKQLSRAELEALSGSIKARDGRDILLVLYAPWCPFCQNTASQAMESEFAALGEYLHRNDSSVYVAKYRADTDREYCAEAFGMKSFPTIVLLSSWRQMYIKYPTEIRNVATFQAFLRNFAGLESP